MPSASPRGDTGNGFDSSLASTGNESNSTPALADLSPRDKPWDCHKTGSDTISRHYQYTEFQSYSERINLCANLLDFRLVPNSNDGDYRLKLANARFCHVRTCQICTWRRSLAYKARAYKTLPKIVDDYPTARFLFLTLTCKNCEIHNLRDYLSKINDAFGRLIRLKFWPALGYLKTVEITRGRDGKSAHPHIHAILMVKASYFGCNYVKKSEWIEMWRRSLRVDYKPILDLQSIKPKDSLVGLLAEVIKYQTKPNDLIFADREWFLEYTRQVHHTRAISFGGVFKEYFKELDKDLTDDDLIGDDSSGDLDEGHLLFGWKRQEKKYRLVDGG